MILGNNLYPSLPAGGRNDSAQIDIDASLIQFSNAKPTNLRLKPQDAELKMPQNQRFSSPFYRASPLASPTPSSARQQQ